MKQLIVLLSGIALSFGVSALVSGAISTGTAGSGRAAVEASDSPFLNPATLPYLHGYFVTSSYSSSSLKSSDLSLSITDNMRETVIPTSLTYSQNTTQADLGGSAKSQDFRLAFGEKVRDLFGVGLALHHKSDQVDQETYVQNNLSLAGAWLFTENLSGGLVFDDFLGTNPSVPEAYRLHSLASTGISYNYKRVVRGKLDLVSGPNNSFSKPQILGGVETFMNRWLIFRVGAGRNMETASNILSAGVGFKGPKFGIHYAYLQGQEAQNYTRHTVDLAIPVW